MNNTNALLDFLTASAKVWAAHPIEFVGALLLGILIGFLLSRLRHQSVIDAQKIHLAMKDESIKAKDAAIASMSANASRTGGSPEITSPKPRHAEATTPAAQPAAPAPTKPQFDDLNNHILTETNAQIQTEIAKTKYKFVFNPKTGYSKVLSFKGNGEIGDGRNANEHRWRIAGGRLEILNSRGELYSRFFMLPDGRLHHTNDPDTLSIKGQYLEPLGDKYLELSRDT